MQVRSIAECVLQVLLSYIMLPVVIKTFVLSIFEWPFYIGFTVQAIYNKQSIIAHTLPQWDDCENRKDAKNQYLVLNRI